MIRYSALGSRWDDYLPLPSGWTENEITQRNSFLLVAILKRDFGEESLFGVKDPRFCRLMPLWFPIFESLRTEPHFVLTVRHPWEVAESLRKRKGVKSSKSFLLWLEHTLQAESASRGYKRTFVAFNELLDDPLVVMTRLQRDLELPIHRGGFARRSTPFWSRLYAITDWIKRRTSKEAGADIPSLATEVYEAIREGDNSPQFAAKLDGLTQQFVCSRKLFYSRLKFSKPSWLISISGLER